MGVHFGPQVTVPKQKKNRVLGETCADTLNGLFGAAIGALVNDMACGSESLYRCT